jgi:hypothetical protein
MSLGVMPDAVRTNAGLSRCSLKSQRRQISQSNQVAIVPICRYLVGCPAMPAWVICIVVIGEPESGVNQLLRWRADCEPAHYCAPLDLGVPHLTVVLRAIAKIDLMIY